jgi:hypothetical protein
MPADNVHVGAYGIRPRCIGTFLWRFHLGVLHTPLRFAISLNGRCNQCFWVGANLRVRPLRVFTWADT